MSFSIAIATLNRYGKINMTIARLEKCKLVSEIIVVDDKSDKLDELIAFKNNLPNHPKVKFYENSENLGPFKNKIKAVSMCSNDWVILLDSDQYIQEDYLGKISKMKLDLDPKCIYHVNQRVIIQTKGSNHHLHFPELVDLPIRFGSDTLYRLIESSYETLIAMSNYLVNRTEYLRVVEKYLPLNIYYHDAGCLTYIWLINGNYLQTTSGLVLYEYANSRKGFYKRFKNFNIAIHEYVKAYLRHDYRDWDFKLASKFAKPEDLITEKEKMLKLYPSWWNLHPHLLREI